MNNEQTFTLEQIAEAIERVYDRSSTGGLTFARVATELTRPPVEFAEGEVILYSYFSDGQPTVEYLVCTGGDSWRMMTTIRKLTTKESGAQELIDALDRITRIDLNAIDANPNRVAVEAATKWRRERGE